MWNICDERVLLHVMNWKTIVQLLLRNFFDYIEKLIKEIFLWIYCNYQFCNYKKSDVVFLSKLKFHVHIYNKWNLLFVYFIYERTIVVYNK